MVELSQLYKQYFDARIVIHGTPDVHQCDDASWSRSFFVLRYGIPRSWPNFRGRKKLSSKRIEPMTIPVSKYCLYS